MKKNILNILLIALGVGFTSCVDLDRYPLEELSDASFWKSADDAEKVVSQLYEYLPYEDEMIDEAINSDDAIHGIKWAAGNVSQGVYDPADFSWSNNYKAIRIANLVLQKVPEMDGYASSDALKQIEGQAYFFRGYEYWTLIRNFGRVPYVDHPLELSEQENITQSERADVLQKVYADFDKAAAQLPTAWPASAYGRVTKGAALGMKARAALYYADYATALKAAEDVQALGVYGLWAEGNPENYASLFWEESDGCNEMMLVHNFEGYVHDGYTIGWECFPTLGWGGIDPTQSLVDAFECIDGKPISESPLYDPLKPFENRDPRLEVNVLHDGETMYGTTITIAPGSGTKECINGCGDATATGYYQQKWLDPNIWPETDGWDTGKDATIMRFAEMLLTIAEAENELNGPTTKAYAAVNRVRNRVGMPNLPEGLSKEQFRERVRNEWRVEFCLEGGLRMWDLRRWGIAEKIYNDITNWYGIKLQEVDGGYLLYQGTPYSYYDKAPGYQKHNYVFPIPQNEIDLNGKLTQNEGY